MLIFAFGSNLSVAQMQRRCPGAVLVGPAMLDGYRLAFGSHSSGWNGGVATVVRAKGHRVRGVVYQLSEEDVARLDRCEGTPWQYRRVSGRVRWGKRVISVQWYALNNKPFSAPSARYLAIIASAYNRFRFSKKALHAALKYTRDEMLREVKRAKRRASKRRPRYSWTPGVDRSRRVPPPSSEQMDLWGRWKR